MGDFTNIDVHCHYFNAEYLYKEIFDIGIAIATGKYVPCTSSMSSGSWNVFTSLVKDELTFAELIKFIKRFFSVSISSCQTKYSEEQKSCKTAFGVENFKCCPLMMDIFYLIQCGVTPYLPKSGINTKLLGPATPDLDLVMTELFDDFKKFVDVVENELNKLGTPPPDFDLSLFSSRKPIQKMVSEGISDTALSSGYKFHLNELENLSREHFNAVFPFLALDPRRGEKVMISLLEKYVDKKKEGEKLFVGVKLYPPMGYLPSHPSLRSVYRWCVERDVPITSHCSSGGFFSLCRKFQVESWCRKTTIVEFPNSSELIGFFANPKEWIPVLEEFPTLRLNLAHFGGEFQFFDYVDSDVPNPQNWTLQIISLLSVVDASGNPLYPNLYTDVAFYSNPRAPPQLAKFLSSPEIGNFVKEKVMFGTDYDILASDVVNGDIDDYLRNFNEMGEFPSLFCHAAKRFLGI